MTNPATPGWPDPAALPFNLFAKMPTQPLTQPLTQGLAGGVDLLKQFWGNLPGGSALPGFLVPTMDVAELDKRIKDLRAAESWVEVNLNMLRGTIQGLEVQRNTIAAIQAFSTMSDHARPDAAATAGSALPTGWPVFEKTPAAAAEPPPAPPAEAAPAQDATTDTPLAAHRWLDFMQDQFNKVAQAALSPPPVAAAPQPAPKKAAAAKKSARRRAPSARKPRTS